MDQPEINNNGTLIENGKFYHAALQFKNYLVNEPEKIKVYEKWI